MAENAILIGVACGENLVLPGVFSEPVRDVVHHLSESPGLQRLALVHHGLLPSMLKRFRVVLAAAHGMNGFSHEAENLFGLLTLAQIGVSVFDGPPVRVTGSPRFQCNK